MDWFLPLLRRLYLEAPACYLAWPAVGMVLGTLVGIASKRLAARLAITPRRLSGLPGIATAPFVHANVAHLAANLPPFLVLGALVLRRDEAHFVAVAGALVLAQGGLVWLLGRHAAHAGMSGVIFGFFGYLLTIAWLTKTPADLLVAVGVLVFYGGMLAGLKPVRDGTSWEGHLFGLVAGIAWAWFVAR